MKMIKFPSIEQYGTTIKNLQFHFQYCGKDENGNAIYDKTKVLPTLTFKGTVKLHGTNAGVSFDVDTGDIWAQSRENIITPMKDNAGFAQFVEKNKDVFIGFFNDIKHTQNIENESIITIFGEWAGPGIQKGVGISQIDSKSFFIFGVKVSPKNEEIPAYWLDEEMAKLIPHGMCLILSNSLHNIYNINSIVQYSIDINLNEPQLSQNLLIELTNAVEQQCPVAKDFGIDGIGEGIVWSTRIGNDVMRFKVKGSAHQSSGQPTTLTGITLSKGDEKKVKDILFDKNLQTGKYDYVIF